MQELKDLILKDNISLIIKTMSHQVLIEINNKYSKITHNLQYNLERLFLVKMNIKFQHCIKKMFKFLKVLNK